MPEQQFEVEVRDHPWGSRGVNSSLDETAKKAAEGAIRPEVRTYAVEVLDGAKKLGRKTNSDRSRADEILKACQAKIWVPDPVFAEYIPPARLLACKKHGDNAQICVKGDDCFVEGTLVLRADYKIVPIETLKVGDKIWGKDRWSEVQRVWHKGQLLVDVIKLSNGAKVPLTPDHHVYILECQRHAHPSEDVSTKFCQCPLHERVERRITVAELLPGMVMVAPERIPFGTGADPDAPFNADQARIEGLYVSDGWSDYEKNNRFFISGQDGKPKEQQKREVVEICNRLGVPTSWARKYVTVRSRDWCSRTQRMGRYAPEKRLLSLDLDEARAAETLRGVMADSCANSGGGDGRTFTTTSYTLFVQTRILFRMFGKTCSSWFISKHGGLGKNPIWRLATRRSQRINQEKFLRVKSVERGVGTAQCWDITTDDHRVYLPEHDVTVSQCDGLVALCAAMFMSVGLHSMIVGHGYGKDKQIRHVICAVRVDGKWLYADPSTPEFRGVFPLGECFPFTHERLLSVPNVQVICDADKCLKSPTLFDPDDHNFIDQGLFVGISGLDPNAEPEEILDAEFEWKLQWIDEEQPTVTKSKTLGTLGGFGNLGLTPEQEKDAEAINKGLSHTELILLASVVISGIGLLWNITRDRRASTSGTPGQALASNGA